jgi:hypothetical protein
MLSSLVRATWARFLESFLKAADKAFEKLRE